MTDVPMQEQTATIAVRVYDHGRLVDTVFCDDEAEARTVVERWTESPGISCQVDDLPVEGDLDDVLEPDLGSDYEIE